MSSKKVRNQLEKKLDCDLLSRKKEIDNLVMDFVNSKENSDDDSDNDSDESEIESSPKAVKRPAKNSSPPAKKQKVASDDDLKDDNESDDNNKSSRRQSSRGGKKKTEKNTKKPRVKKVNIVLLSVFTMALQYFLKYFRMAKNAKVVDIHVH